jgi:uncharacterized protein (TIGR00255 family)
MQGVYMVYSMTGYGRSEKENDLQKVLIEMKAVNHRYCDIVLKMPKKMAMFEERIKKIVKKHVKRGRVEIYMGFEEQKGEDFVVSPNFAVLDQYVEALKSIKDRYDISRDYDLNLLTRFQDTFSIEYKEVDEEAIWALIESALNEALESLVKMRTIEGEKLLVDINERISTIKAVIVELEKRAPEIVTIHKGKMKERISELLEDNIEIDEVRLTQEVAYFADKTNITEELVRLASHLEQLDGIFEEKQSIGRKLDFLLQEINREINTIGSKSPDVDISNFVIELKSEFEKIREQIQNIE